MKRLTPSVALIIPALIFVAGCAGETGDRTDAETPADSATTHHMDGMSIDAVTANPNVYKELHEDERVRVLEMYLPAGETDGMHSHMDEAVYFISGSELVVHLPDGSPVELDVPDGSVLSHEAWSHTVENAGETDVHAVIVELQPGALDSAGTVPEGLGAAEASPDVYSLRLEDDRVRIIEMKLPAGQSDNEHVHSAEVVYFLSGGKVKVHLPDGQVIEAEFPDGGVLSSPMWQHRVENVGETDIHAVIFELNQSEAV